MNLKGVKMKKMLILVILLLLFAFIFSNNANTDYIIVLDVSKSMMEDDLFNKAKGSLTTFLSKTISIGDRVILYSFDEFPRLVEDSKINNSSDIDNLLTGIKNMQALGMKTYITNAIDASTKRLIDIHKADSQRNKYMLLITDGKNESPLDYDTLINKYKKFLKTEGINFDVLSIGVADAKLKNFCIKTEANYYSIDRFDPKPDPDSGSIIENVFIKYNINPQRLKANEKHDVKIKINAEGTISEKVNLRFRIDNESRESIVLDTLITVSSKGSSHNFILPYYSEKEQKDKFTINVTASNNKNPVFIKPEKHTFTIESVIPKPLLSKKAINILITIAIIIFLLALIGFLLFYYDHMHKAVFDRYNISFTSNDSMNLGGYKKFLKNEIQLKEITPGISDRHNVYFKTNKPFFPSDMRIVCEDNDAWVKPDYDEIMGSVENSTIEFRSKEENIHFEIK